jgi:hypothetical protein
MNQGGIDTDRLDAKYAASTATSRSSATAPAGGMSLG